MNETDTCRGPECTKPIRYKKHGLCTGHAAQLRKGLELTPLQERATYRKKPCVGPECTRNARSMTAEDGLCLVHYRQKLAGRPLIPLVCTVPECSNPLKVRDWCTNHARNWRKYGTPIAPPRTVEQKCEGPECEVMTTVRRKYCPGHRGQIDQGRPLTPLRPRNWDPIDRFNVHWEIGPNGCHLWTAGVNSTTGYGHFYAGKDANGARQWMPAHRWIWLYTHPDEPAPEHVCHRCDVSLCVNPKHLYAGTAAENMADRDARGRGGSGKLNRKAAEAIRERYTSNADIPELAKQYGVAPRTIYAVIRGETYKAERKPPRRLTESEVIEIRRLHASGEVTPTELARRFDVTYTAIYDVIRRNTWKHI